MITETKLHKRLLSEYEHPLITSDSIPKVGRLVTVGIPSDDNLKEDVIKLIDIVLEEERDNMFKVERIELSFMKEFTYE